MRQNLTIIIACTFLTACLYIALVMLVPMRNTNKYFEIEIPKGATFRQAIETLYNKKLIRDRNILLLIGRLTGADRKIRAGYYSMRSNMSPADIFRMILEGQIMVCQIRIVEGDSLIEISEKLAKAGLMTRDAFFHLARNPDFLASHAIESLTIEGYIFPDTYKIPKGIKPEDTVGIMIDRMREKYSGELVLRTVELGMTENEVLTLASIIEKEAIVDSERPLIAAVYHNRLKKKMRLQADPTAIYGVKSFREKITRADLLRKTPYNTYAFKGLPPGPIASPGLKSIKAALYPADAPYLFFVSKDNITHRFSVTVQEHLDAVRLYRMRKQAVTDKTKEKSLDDGTS